MSIYDALPLIRDGLSESLFAAKSTNIGARNTTHPPRQKQAQTTFGDINHLILSEDGTKLTLTVRDGLTFNMLGGIADIVWAQPGVLTYTIENMQDYAEVDCLATVTLTVCPKTTKATAAQTLGCALERVLQVL